ncbi:hypothetical protein DPMN_140782 [Dreissena polymorpha]|uniref:Uncharacterized protein n=1 Tax=Dreissena polymorpha TaxID=45954 RepID=A0A9D4G8R7_DREPO|nr:hypothetical protein DPMN_140782 [Dreissena polymorpha]
MTCIISILAWQRPTWLVMGPCIVEIDQVNRCRNEEVIVKGNFGWGWPMWAGAPGLVMGPCIVETDRIVIREVQYQLEGIVKGNFGWVWPMWAGRTRVVNGAMNKVKYQSEVNRCRNEEIKVKGNFGWV